MEEIKGNNEQYVEVDKNLIIETSIDEPDIRFFDVRNAPFGIYGLYKPHTGEYFCRVPEDIAAATSAGVARLAKESVGGRVRFTTDSPYIAIKAEYKAVGRGSHTPLEASAGFDLYEDYEYFGESRFVKPLLPQYKMTDNYEQIYRFHTRALRHITINFPIHSCVKNLYVGLADGSVLTEGVKYRSALPIVVYGSSIVHGTGATRPGLIYTNILTRRLNMDVINLGFSGNARAEDAIVDFCAGLDTSIFVCDYDHNAPDAESLQKTHRKMYETFRQSQPDTPYVMISRPNGATHDIQNAPTRRDVIIDTYRYARETGDANVWYIDGESFFLGKNENDCTIDTVHPNDMGYSLMADGIECVIRRIMNERNCIL